MSENPIYHYRASDELSEEAWGKLRDATVTVVTPYYATGYYPEDRWDVAAGQFRVWEGEYKKATGLPIPPAYRSAKSVLKNAIKHGLPFAGAAKSAMEKMIKEKKAKDKEVLTPDEQLDKMLTAASDYAVQHNLDWYSRIETILKTR